MKNDKNFEIKVNDIYTESIEVVIDGENYVLIKEDFYNNLKKIESKCNKLEETIMSDVDTFMLNIDDYETEIDDDDEDLMLYIEDASIEKLERLRELVESAIDFKQYAYEFIETEETDCDKRKITFEIELASDIDEDDFTLDGEDLLVDCDVFGKFTVEELEYIRNLVLEALKSIDYDDYDDEDDEYFYHD